MKTKLAGINRRKKILTKKWSDCPRTHKQNQEQTAERKSMSKERSKNDPVAVATVAKVDAFGMRVAKNGDVINHRDFCFVATL